MNFIVTKFSSSIVLPLIFLSLSGLLMISCGTEEEPPTIDFGADYSVIISDELPAIINNELNVEVLYTGCEPGHEFELNFQQIGENENELWLTKITPNEDCNTEFREVIVLPLPEELQSGRLVFTMPNGQLVLRDG
jgi:hypothetical protein